MSRCFPYPPPGYVRKVAGTEAALIESIKLQSERRENKAETKKEKSKHKKEKSKHKKERSKDKKHKSKEHKEKSSGRHSSKDRKRKECPKEDKDLLKRTKVEAAEQLEKSGLTEEHGQPVWPHSPGYLSDGTQINHKRKRDATLLPNEGSKPGKIIRIKLASSLSRKDDSSARCEQTCSTSGRDNFLDHKRDDTCRGPMLQKTCFTKAETAVVVKDPASSFCFTKAETAVSVKDPASSKPKIKGPLPDISSQSKLVSLPPRTRRPAQSAYDALFDKWAPPPIQLEQQMDDEDWLFGTRKQDGQTTMTNKAFSSVPSCRSSSGWPRAQFLADADVYSLPYTIPF